MIDKYMDLKGGEQLEFDPSRARKIYRKLKPYLNMRSYNIHIMGTNGKGSTGRFIARNIFLNGKTVFHFTSPHILDFKERFYKNGSTVSKGELEKAHSFLQRFSFVNKSSYFEYATFLAMVLSQDCEFCVMEAGVGGEFDSTSLIDYRISVYTKIGIDHENILGYGVENISSTKLRAMQGEVFLHTQEHEAVCSIAERISKDKGLSLHNLKKEDIDSFLDKIGDKTTLPPFLKGNLCLAKMVLDFMKMELVSTDLDLFGRYSRIETNIWVDVGHNEMAATAVADLFFEQKVVLVYNTYKDKKFQAIIGILKNIIRSVVVFKVCGDRVLETDVLCEYLSIAGIGYEVFDPSVDSNFIRDGINYLVFGSFALVSEFMKWRASDVR